MSYSLSPSVPSILKRLKEAHLHKAESYKENIIHRPNREPFGIWVFGDPHLDSMGTAHEQLERDMKYIRLNDNVYAGSLGDLTDNWVGRLQRLFEHSNVTREDATALIRWFIHLGDDTNKALAKKWIFFIMGNHDLWNNNNYLIGEILNGHKVDMKCVRDWALRTIIKFPKERDIIIYAAHDFKGRSMYDAAFGAKKKVYKGGTDDVYICGHTHEFAYGMYPNIHNKASHTIKVAGYKELDDFSHQTMGKEQKKKQFGHGCFLLINPNDRSADRLKVYFTLETGVSLLNALLKRYDNTIKSMKL